MELWSTLYFEGIDRDIRKYLWFMGDGEIVKHVKDIKWLLWLKKLLELGKLTCIR